MSEDLARTTEALPPTAGQLLKAARERQGMHISVLAASLKVSRRKLELIEADRYEELPDATFVRALASSMCRALKLDAAEVLQSLPEAPTRLLEPSRGLNRPFHERESSGWTEGWEWSRRLSLPLVASLMLVGAAAVLYLAPIDFVPEGMLASLGGVKSGPADSGASPARAPSGEAAPAFPPADAGAPQMIPPAASAAPAVAFAPAATASSVATASPVAASAVPARMAETVTERATAPAAPSGLLGLRVTDTSWIEVRDAQGQVLLARRLSAGETASLDGALPLRVTVGNAAGTQVTFRGQPVSLAASTRENVARLELQ